MDEYQKKKTERVRWWTGLNSRDSNGAAWKWVDGTDYKENLVYVLATLQCTLDNIVIYPSI